MKKILLLLAGSLLLSACHKKLTKTIEKTKDETNTAFIKKDSTFYTDSLYTLMPDSSMITIPVSAEWGKISVPEITFQNPRIRHSVSIKSGNLVSVCNCLPQELLLKIKNRHIQTLLSIISKKQDIKFTHDTTLIPYLPLWAKILCWIGGISALYWIFRIVKFFL